MAVAPSPPRWSLALLSGLAAAVLAWGALTLPTQDFTRFAVLTGLLATLHGLTAVLRLAGLPVGLRTWRVQSWASLAWLGWIGWNLTTAALYVSQLYGSLGRGIGVVLLACTGLCGLVVLPLAFWGLSATGGLRSRKGEAGIVAFAVALAAAGLGQAAMEGGAEATPAALSEIDLAALAPPPGPPPPSLLFSAPTHCPAPPGPEFATAFLTLAPGAASGGTAVTSRCLQAATPAALLSLLQAATADAAPGSRLKLDLVSAVQPLPDLEGPLAALALRPGLDGACRDTACLMPWQLVAEDQFNTYRPFAAVPDVRFGLEPLVLQHALGSSAEADGLAGLTRIETQSFVVEAGGQVTPLRRLHADRPTITAGALQAAAEAAQAQVLAANLESGRFRYLLNPMRGTTSSKNFALPRQGGTTYTLCDVGDDSSAVDQAAARSLGMMATLERSLDGDMGALQYPAERTTRRIGLGQSTLPLVALLTCRPRVGPEHDALIGRLGRFVLALQRADGGYNPLWDRQTARVVPGKEPTYVGGQATLALILLEDLQRREQLPELPSVPVIAAAVERSMAWYGGDYWDHGARDFLFLEENWHCIAARTALTFHRNDAYERLCLDYVAMKSRLVLAPDDRVDDDMVGGFGWGNVLVPHNTGTAGYVEALAASMAIKHARGEPLQADVARIGHSLGFLLQNQWTETTCFACAREPAVPGSWSEHMASPVIRIDYVQHAWAGVAHSARMLGLAERG